MVTVSPIRERSIPACAGEPEIRRSSTAHGRVYPRVCGGTRWNPSMSRPNTGSIPACAGEPRSCRRWKPFTEYVGLSPRVRGNRRRRPFSPKSSGSIPACAGEPGIPACSGGTVGLSPRVRGNRGLTMDKGAWVYPRVCGGTFVRGMNSERAIGSIPACAGEPTPNQTRDP